MQKDTQADLIEIFCKIFLEKRYLYFFASQENKVINKISILMYELFRTIKKDVDFINNHNYEKKLNQIQKYLTISILHYQNNPDFIISCAVILILKKQYKEALKILQQSSLILNNYHCYYHFIGYKCNYNIFVILNILNLKNEECNKDFYLNRANFLYNENINQNYKKTENEFSIQKLSSEDFHSEENNFDISSCIFSNNIYLKQLKIAEILFEDKNYLHSFSVFKDINNIIEKQHFNYHCILSLHFFIQGILFKIEKKFDVARYLYHKALEQDKNNSLNDKIKKEIKKEINWIDFNI